MSLTDRINVEDDGYEYGIGHHRFDENSADGPHRSGFTKAEADEWVREALDDGVPDDFFFVIRRPRGQWERV